MFSLIKFYIWDENSSKFSTILKLGQSVEVAMKKNKSNQTNKQKTKQKQKQKHSHTHKKRTVTFFDDGSFFNNLRSFWSVTAWFFSYLLVKKKENV